MTNTLIDNKKKKIFGDHSSSSRTSSIQQNTVNKVNLSYGSYYIKNNTEKNSVNSALVRVRSGGAVVPIKKGCVSKN